MAGGRKCEFDKASALEAAMQVFWQKGYLGAALSDLTQAMGINKPSLYAAFGNKEALFVQATAHYLETCAVVNDHLLREPGLPLRERLQNYCLAVIDGQCSGKKAKGCFVTLCLAEAAGEGMPPEAEAAVEVASRHAQTLLADVFREDEEARARGLSEEAERNALFVLTVISGTASMARGGTPQEALSSVVERMLEGLGLPRVA